LGKRIDRGSVEMFNPVVLAMSVRDFGRYNACPPVLADIVQFIALSSFRQKCGNSSSRASGALVNDVGIDIKHRPRRLARRQQCLAER
jgi:hypothetical protein